MVWLYRQINYVRGHRQWHAMKETILSPQRIDAYNRQHRQLFDLKSRDVEAAVAVLTASGRSAPRPAGRAGRQRAADHLGPARAMSGVAAEG